jgi:hypothetical protein
VDTKWLTTWWEKQATWAKVLSAVFVGLLLLFIVFIGVFVRGVNVKPNPDNKQRDDLTRADGAATNQLNDRVREGQGLINKLDDVVQDGKGLEGSGNDLASATEKFLRESNTGSNGGVKGKG